MHVSQEMPTLLPWHLDCLTPLCNHTLAVCSIKSATLLLSGGAQGPSCSQLNLSSLYLRPREILHFVALVCSGMLWSDTLQRQCDYDARRTAAAQRRSGGMGDGEGEGEGEFNIDFCGYCCK